MTIAVTGATGQFGRHVIDSLKDRVDSANIVALVRSPEKAADLGVAVRKADYNAPETLAPALQGVDTLLLVSSSEIGQRTAQHRNVIEAAKAAGVSRIVYTSVLKADTSPLGEASIPLAQEHIETETELGASGLKVTILRNGWYTENYTASVPLVLSIGTLYGAAGEGRFSFATRKDYAEAAAIVLTTEGHDGKTYELAGDTAHTLRDVAAEISRQSGRSIPYENLPEADYAAVLVDAGLPAPLAGGFASLETAAARDALLHDETVLSALIGRATTPLSDAIAEMMPAPATE